MVSRPMALLSTRACSAWIAPIVGICDTRALSPEHQQLGRTSQGPLAAGKTRKHAVLARRHAKLLRSRSAIVAAGRWTDGSGGEITSGLASPGASGGAASTTYCLSL